MNDLTIMIPINQGISYRYMIQSDIFKKLQETHIRISSIARGIAIGDELEYTDQLTLGAAISSRMPYENSIVK